MIDLARAHAPGFEDIAIAATTAARGLIVLTANERHFEPLGAPFANPLKRLPSPFKAVSCVRSKAGKGSGPMRDWMRSRTESGQYASVSDDVRCSRTRRRERRARP